MKLIGTSFSELSGSIVSASNLDRLRIWSVQGEGQLNQGDRLVKTE